MTGALARLAIAAAAVAAAAYLIPATVHIVAWPSGGPVRIALLAPLSRLWWTLAASATLAGALLAACRGHQAHLDRLATASEPLSLLFLWVVPFVPWLPDRAPLLLVLGGPLRWVILTCAVAWAIAQHAGIVVAAVRDTRTAVFVVSLVVMRRARPALRRRYRLRRRPATTSSSRTACSSITTWTSRTTTAPRSLSGTAADYLSARGGEIYSIRPGLPALLVPRLRHCRRARRRRDGAAGGAWRRPSSIWPHSSPGRARRICVGRRVFDGPVRRTPDHHPRTAGRARSGVVGVVNAAAGHVAGPGVRPRCAAGILPWLHEVRGLSRAHRRCRRCASGRASATGVAGRRRCRSPDETFFTAPTALDRGAIAARRS